MYTITKIQNANLRNRYSFDENGSPQRWIEVHIKYAGNWYDISEDVETIEITHKLTIDGLSSMDNAAIKLHNELGQWDFMKVTPTFNVANKQYNPPIVSMNNKPFLTTNFPIRIVVKYKENDNIKSFTLFLGYAFRIYNEQKATATLEIYDVFFKLNEKRLYTAYTVPLGRPNDLILPFIDWLRSQIATDFGVTTEILFNNFTESSMLSSNVTYTIEGGKTYLEAINNALSSTAGILLFNPEEFIPAGNKTRIRSYFTGDGSFQLTPSTTYAIDYTEIDTYEYEYRNDLPTRITINSPQYDVYPELVDNVWSFNANTNLNNAILIPANSQSYVTIDFGTKAINPETEIIQELGNKKFIICQKLTIVSYVKTINPNTNSVTYIAGTDQSRFFRTNDNRLLKLIPLEPDNTYSLTNEITDASNNKYGLYVVDTKVGLNQITLLLRNNTSYNYAIVEMSIKAYPLIETGANAYVYDTGQTPVIENSMELCYMSINNNLAQRIANARFTLIDSKYNAKIQLKGFYPELYPGAAITISLPDTSMQNVVGFVDTVKHVINAERCVTNIDVKFGNVTLTPINGDYYFNPEEYKVSIIVEPENNIVLDAPAFISIQ